MSVRVGKVSLILRGDVWHYRFSVPGAPRRMRSTKETRQGRAEAVALTAYEEAMLRARGEEPVPTLEEAFKLWVKAHVLRKSVSHVANIERCGRLHLGELKTLLLNQVTTGAVEEELNRFLATHAPGSGNQWLTYLRIVCKWAIRRKMIRAVPFEVPETKLKKKAKVLIPTSKAEAWLAEVDALTEDEPGIAMVLRLMIGVGLRGAEARQARWEWLDLEREVYTPVDTKGGEAWPRPLPPWIVEELKSRAEPYGWMAPTLAGKAVTPGRVQRVFDAACRAIEIPRMVPHRLRATYATWLSEEGVPIQDIQVALEHKDIRTTAIYLGVDLGRVAQAQRRIAKKTGMSWRKTGAESE